MSLSKLFRDLARGNFEYKNGRIIRFPNLWAWVGEYPDRISAGWKDKRIDERTGKEYCLVRKEAVRCPNVELWPDNYIDNKDLAWVAWSDCRKCQYYLKGKRRGKMRWPRCQLSIDKRKDEDVNTGLDVLHAALRDTAKTRY